MSKRNTRTRGRLPWFLWTATALLSSCSAASPPIDTSVADAVVPDQWTSPYTPAETSSSASDHHWWQDFGSPELDALIEEALANNHDLAAAGARVDAAVATARVAGADLFPQLSAGIGGRRTKSFIGSFIPQGIGGGGRTAQFNQSNQFGASLDVSWELDIWGRIRAGQAADTAASEALLADLIGAKLSIAAQTAKAWHAAVEASKQLSLARETAENYHESVRRIRSRYESGLRSSLDLRLAETELSSAEALIANREELLDRAVRQVEVLAGRYPSRDLTVAEELSTLDRFAPTILPSRLLERRPDLIAAERRLAASGARVDEAKALIFPRLSLSGSTGTASNRAGDLDDLDFNVWSIAGNLLQPIFQGGRIRHGIARSEALQREALEQYVSSVLAAYSEAETLYAADHLIAERVVHLGEAAKQARAAAELAEQRYQSGLEDYVTVLSSQRTELNARSRLLSARRERLDARTNLYLALGGNMIESSSSAAPQTTAPLESFTETDSHRAPNSGAADEAS